MSVENYHMKNTYNSILEEYTEKLENATRILMEEYKKEAAKNKNGLSGLAQLSSDKISKLAEILSEGTAKMAEIFHSAGETGYSEYQEWSAKLYDVYSVEAAIISSSYK